MSDPSKRQIQTPGQPPVRDSGPVEEVRGNREVPPTPAETPEERVDVEAKNVVTFHVGHRMSPATDVRQFYDIADRVEHLPGVRAAGFTQLLPLQNWGWTSNSSDFRVRGRPARPQEFAIELRFVTPGYFEALGIPIKRGRGFTRGDTLPAGVTIYGRAWSEAALLRIAYAYEQATHHRRAPSSTPPLIN